MSRLDNVDSLEQKLADLQMSRELSSPSKSKKIPPAVPPKKKAQPHVPQSAVVNTLREPSYSAKIPSSVSNNNRPTFSSSLSNVRISPNYANMSHMNTSVPLHYGQSLSPQIHKSNYSNVTNFRTENNSLLPSLPPPPLPLYTPPTKSLEKGNNEDNLPPPSPVSSNYSELARATANLSYNQERPYPIYQNEFSEYGTSQGSTYESIYEPITLRPPSNLSGHTDNSNHGFHRNNTTNKSPLPKEEEVDALTNLLVQSISDSQDLDVYGVCIKCKEKVIKESSGCTAMGHVYHVQCFCCYICSSNLQGKPFYAVEGQPYCELDYYETLEKCSVCDEPILDRILRATGKPYHPACFSCVVCGKSLDGIPFTVDAMNQIHCIDDFHKKFAPKCCVCELPIMPEEGEEETVRVVALDRSFHVRCYRCEDCGFLLSSEAEGRGCYPLDDHILCKICNAHRIRLLTNVMTTDL